MNAFRIGVAALLLWAATQQAARAQPSNDQRARATSVTGIPFSATGTTTGATREPDEPAPHCAPIVATVWFRYTAQETRPLAITTAGSSFDTVLALWRQTPDGLQHLECDDDSGMHTQSMVSFPAVSGDTYYIQVGAGPAFVAPTPARDQRRARGWAVLRGRGGRRRPVRRSGVGRGRIRRRDLRGTFTGGSIHAENGSVNESRVCASAGLIVAVEHCT